MPVGRIGPGQEPVERLEEIIIGPGPELHDHDTRGGMRHEDVEQAVAVVRDEATAGIGQVGEAAPAAGSNRQLGGLQGKMLRSASRMRPSPPPTGVDS